MAISTMEDVLAAEPVIRRVVAARVANPADVDDLVHDCLERMLAARHRLAPTTVVPFSVVTARNLVFSQARTAGRRARAAPTVERRESDRPEDQVLADEARTAMQVALAQLSPGERAEILAYQEHGTRDPSSGRHESPGAIRVRMSRTRAKLRLEYLLAFRRVRLPTAACRPVLLAISAGDSRRQRALHAGDHLLGCVTCAGLSEPLARRSLALTAVIAPIAAAGRLGAKARAHPGTTATAAAVATAVAATALVHATSAHPAARPAAPAVIRSAPPVHRARAAAPRDRTITGLAIKASGVTDDDLRPAAGQTVQATNVSVEQVVSHNGFWVGPDATDRAWVELVGPLRDLRIEKGDRLSFQATVRANGPSYAARLGPGDAAGKALLDREGAHIDLTTTSVRITAR